MTPQELESIRERVASAGGESSDGQVLLAEVDRLRGALEVIANLPDMSMFRPVRRMAQSALDGEVLEPLHENHMPEQVPQGHPTPSPLLHLVPHR